MLNVTVVHAWITHMIIVHAAGMFNDKIVTHQVKYLGLMENLRVRRAGFAYRRPYEMFLQRYKCLTPTTWPNYHGPPKQGVHEIVCHLGFDKDEYRMGK
jgi:myosin-1